ncbi:Leucine-rich repeat-containing protein 4C [Holothuria leucospilota]|uniref:Leucine-rich repeat-containing protein 4C n=1 Tax=Holothuria leucospilota TaxID=206669 RepID=A0A9Q1H3X5_HOLLE|nr:Leucine-rich repeat-containing protein 4C [Holothuria leucospilota]
MPSPQTNTSRVVPVCGEACEYDDWFQRAHCEERDLDQVPLSLGCESSRILELQVNRIQRIGLQSFSGYRNVKTLDLSRNDISIVAPESFLNVNQLKNIILSQNYLTKIYNGTFAGTEYHLERIYLNNNHITNMSRWAFQGLSTLSLLYLNSDEIRYLPPDVFSEVVSLQYLSLSDNQLTEIAASTFRGLVNLQTVFLDNNALTVLPEGLFADLESLREVDLSHNNLVFVPLQNTGFSPLQVLNLEDNHLKSDVILPYLSISQRLYIGGNPFICDRDFHRIQQWYLYHTEVDSIYYAHRRPPQCVTYDMNNTTSDTVTFLPEDIIPTSDTPSRMAVSNKFVDFSVKTESKIESTTTTAKETEPTLTSSTEHYHESEKYGNEACELHELFIYCVVILSVFFALWVMKSVGRLLFLRQKRTVDNKMNTLII